MNHEHPHDRRLKDWVRPGAWVNPSPTGTYNLVVLGGGPAGLVAAFGAAGLGARVALVERDALGGDCLLHGCVPSKALLAVAHTAARVRSAPALGVHLPPGDVTVDFTAALDRMRRIRADIGPHDSAERLAQAGIDVFFGEARFSSATSVSVAGATLTFSKALIATGARAVVPDLPGLRALRPRTNRDIFDLPALPGRLTVLGAGVVGCELAQAFARLGSTVTLVEQADRVLSREDAEASRRVADQLEADGVILRLESLVQAAEPLGGSAATGQRLRFSDGTTVEGDALLVATGRTPNVDLDLERAGVTLGDLGIAVDDRLQTTNPRIYACGDVLGHTQYTHAADHQARAVLRNALFLGQARASALVIPRVAYTDPEVAAVGLSARDAAARAGVSTFSATLEDTDRGKTDGTSGHCAVHIDQRGRILGACIVARDAGELLAPLTLAMTHGLTLGQLAQTIHPYPTRSELVFKVASAYNRTRLTPRVQSWMARWLRLAR